MITIEAFRSRLDERPRSCREVFGAYGALPYVSEQLGKVRHSSRINLGAGGDIRIPHSVGKLPEVSAAFLQWQRVPSSLGGEFLRMRSDIGHEQRIGVQIEVAAIEIVKHPLGIGLGERVECA